MIICKELGFLFPKGSTLKSIHETYKADKDSRASGFILDGAQYIFLSVLIKFGITDIRRTTEISSFIDERDDGRERAQMRFYYQKTPALRDLGEFKWIAAEKLGIRFTSK